MRKIQPKKLLLSKWTVANPVAKQKHFLVTKLIRAEPNDPIEVVEIEAIYSKKTSRIDWRDLRDESVWRQGWL